MDKAIKIFRNPLFMIIAGAVFGILAKYGDIAYANSIFSFFGLLTSGFAIWLVIGTAIIYISNSRNLLLSAATKNLTRSKTLPAGFWKKLWNGI